MGVEEAQEQLGDRGLPRTARADEREHLAWSPTEGNVVQRRFLRTRVVKANGVELHHAPCSVQRTRPRLVLHRGLLVEVLDDPLCARGGGVEGVEQAAQAPDRAVEPPR